MAKTYGDIGPDGTYYLYNLSEYGIEIYVRLSDSWSNVSGFDAYGDLLIGYHDESVADSSVHFNTDSIVWYEDPF